MFAALYDNWVNKSNLAIRHMNELQSQLDDGIDDLSIRAQIELINRLHFINPEGATAILEEPEWQMGSGLICGR